MTRCSRCGSEAPDGDRFCAACGLELEPGSRLPTESGPEMPPDGPRPPSSPRRLHRSDVLVPGAFTPGEMVAGRFRIVGLLGRGGMGEVYRADDLKLGQAVALKFLPKAVSADPELLARFHAEVRLARQVSHPNVCRVYDIAEFDGRHFLSMEYVDGEDLASLLKRIGHLPGEKAVEVARQLCAGIAAAHEKGVLHRDLKPSNVMLDGRGRVRITDFGLAIGGEEAPGALEVVGTPAYMSPEQLSGRPATVRSDLYALGLVLYEVFTGRRAFEAGSFAEARRKQEEPPAPPSGVASGIDPVVDRVILRCLEKDPASRPSSALALASALPGGDPLAAALAAGETPSPEMVAAAGEEGTLAARPAWALLGGIVVLVASVLLISGVARDVGLAPPEKSRDFLRDRAREIAARLGWTATPADSASTFERDYPFLSWMARNAPPGWAGRLSSSWWTPTVFLFRQSPQPLVPRDFRGVVRPEDPPMDVSGMLSLDLDGRGRLRRLLAVPRRVPADASPSPPVAWGPAFAEAGLEEKDFVPSEPPWFPPVPYDALAGWRGTVPGMPEASLVVVAASRAGHPVYFELVAPWSEVGRGPRRPVSIRGNVTDVVQLALSVGFTLAGVFFARRNLRLGRGDRTGALRLATTVFLLALVSHLLGRHVSASPGVLDRAFWESLGNALPPALVVAVVYLALEPYFRRRYPELLVSWTRLLSGRVRDPLVGRDHLLGVLAGLAVCLLLSLENVPPALFAARGQTPMPVEPQSLDGLSGLASFAAWKAAESLYFLFYTAAALFLSRLVLRNAALAAAATWLVLFASVAGRENPLFEMTGGVLIATVFLAVLLRGGLLGLAVAFGVFNLLARAPITPDLTEWFAGYGLSCLAVVLAVAIYGFWAARGGVVLPGAADE